MPTDADSIFALASELDADQRSALAGKLLDAAIDDADDLTTVMESFLDELPANAQDELSRAMTDPDYFAPVKSPDDEDDDDAEG